jgi:hypothetical protein
MNGLDELRCPKCDTVVELGQERCHDCGAAIAWRDGLPERRVAQAMSVPGRIVAVLLLGIMLMIAFSYFESCR